jgi:hypothetical protein
MKAPGGSQELRPHQQEALEAARSEGGLFGDMPVGSGKTHITYLLPLVFPECTRVALIMPGGLIHKTYDEFDIISDHWCIRPEVRVKFFGVEVLSCESHATAIEDYAPDLVIVDEADRLQEGGTAATKRLMRYLEKQPETKCCLMSGSMFGGKWENIGRLLWLAFRDKSPLPPSEATLRRWDRMIEQKMPWLLPPELKQYGRTIEEINIGLTQHIQAHPGVVSVDSDRGRAELRLRKRDIPPPPIVVQRVLDLLEETQIAPGSREIECLPSDMARHRSTLAWGFYYRYWPEPPREWLDARRMWARFVRMHLQRRYDDLDTEAQIQKACQRGEFDSDGIWEEWQSIKPQYRVSREAVWLSHEAIDALPAPEERTLYWVRFRGLGEAVAAHFGIPFYNKGAADMLEQQRGPCVVSIKSHSTGRNLQYRWSRNHILNIPAKPKIWEQMLGRTMRPGQTEDFVDADVWITPRDRAKFREVCDKDALIAEARSAPTLLSLASID